MINTEERKRETTTIRGKKKQIKKIHLVSTCNPAGEHVTTFVAR
jgi:hypothetical protein